MAFREIELKEPTQAKPMTRFEAGLKGAEQGFGFNLADETYGGAAMLGKLAQLDFSSAGPAYIAKRDLYREREDLARNQFPATYNTANVAGAVLPIAAATLATGGAATGPMVAARLPAVATAGGRITQAARLGAAQGAVAGYGASEGDPLRQVAQTAGGGVLGLAGGGIISGLTEGGRALINRFGPRSIEKAAQQLTTKGLLGDAVTPDDLTANAQRMIDLGKNEAVLADVGGAKMQDQITALGQAQGPQLRFMESVLSPRTEGQLGRITGDVNEAFGNKGNVYQSLDNMMEARRAAAGPAYKLAYEAPVDFGTPEVKGLLSKVPAKAFAEAQEIANVSGYNQNVPAIAGDETSAINTEGMDYILRGLNDVKGQAFNRGASGYGTKLNSLSKELTAEVYKQNPLLAEARRKYAGDTAAMEMVEEGKGLLGKGNQYTDYYMQGIGQGNEVFPQEGLRSALLERLSKVGKGNNTARPIDNFQGAQDIISSVLRSPEKAGRFFEQLGAETTMFDTASALARGRNTGANLGALSQVEGTPAANLAQGRSNLIFRGIDKLMSNPQRTMDVNEQAARNLMQPVSDSQIFREAYENDIRLMMRNDLLSRATGKAFGRTFGDKPADYTTGN
jgi:hypothetical protein